MLWDIPYSKNYSIIHGNSVFIGHASKIKKQLNSNKYGLKIILIY
jgi:hypothetical protein